MIDPTGGFFEPIGVTQDLLVRFASALLAWVEPLVEQLRRALERFALNPPPPRAELAEALRRLEHGPPIPGYEAILIGEGHDPLSARFVAAAILWLGEEYLEEVEAERRLASAIFGVVKARDATSLVVSRRARIIMVALEDGRAMPALRAAWAKSNLPDAEYSFLPLLERAFERDETACKELVAICTKLRPHLVDPRGRIPSLATVTHELLLHSVDRAYTYDAIEDVYDDPATVATRRALNDPTFDPRPARRRQKARQERLIPADAMG